MTSAPSVVVAPSGAPDAAPAAAFRYAILGPVELRDGERVLNVGGPLQVRLLAYLLIHANRVRSTDQLIDDVWGGLAGGSRKGVQMAIGRLRRTLPPAARPSLRTVADGYVLAVGPSELDAEVFAARLAEGRHALADGRREDAVRVLRAAEALWRGNALADVEYDAFAQGEVRRLKELRAVALETRVQAELELGEHAALVGELEARLRDDPTHERLAEQLMLAYYRCGRQDEALATYQRVRGELDEQLGLEPGPALRAMHEQILQQSGALALPRASARVHARTWPMPLPATLRAAPDSLYVGRVEQCARLREIVAAAREARHVVWIAGEPGVGKTSLAAYAGRHAHEAGFSVAYGAPAGEISVPYGPWVGALSHLVNHAPYGPLATHVRTHDAELSRLVPGLRDALAPLPPARTSHPDTERSLLFNAVAGWLEALCEAGPLVLVLDDLQWADTPSVTLLAHVLAATPELPLLLVLAYRHTDVAGHPLLELLPERPRTPGVEQMALRGLAFGDVAQLMTRGEGELTTEGLRVAWRIQHETGGNAFEVGELLRPLHESGAIAQDRAGNWHVHVRVADLRPPEGVLGVVNRRVRRLGERAEAILAVAAVVGLSFEVELVERLVDDREEDLLAALEAAERGEIVTESEGEPGRYAFAHAQIWKAVYQSLGDTRRARMHRRVAEALEQLDPGERVAELAHHWGAAGAEHVEKVRHYAWLAGERALDQLAPEDAVGWFRRALELFARDGDEGERCDLLIRLGEAQRRSGDPTFGTTLLEAAAVAERLGDDERLTRAVLANTLGPFGAAGEPDRPRIATLERALEVVPEDWPFRAHMLATLAKELYYGGEPGRAPDLSVRALALARQDCGPRELARVIALATATSPIMPLAAHATLVDALTDLAQEIDDPELRFRAANATFILGMHTGERARLDAGLGRMANLDRQIGQSLFHWHVLWARSALETLAGRLDAGESLALMAEAEARAHGRTQGGLIAFGQLLSVYTEWCRLDELRERLERLIEENPALPILKLARGFIDAETGRLESAEAVLQRATSLGFEFPFDRTRAFDLARCADIALRVGARAQAATLYEKLLGHRDHFATVSGISSRGSIELALGRLATMLADVRAADEHLALAERAHERMAAPLLRARTALAQAQLCVEAAPERAPGYLQTALNLAEQHGSEAIRREALQLQAG